MRGYSLKDAGKRLDLAQLNILVTGFLQEPGSHLRRAIAGGQAAEWDIRTELLALLFDQFSMLRFELGGGKGRQPEPLERPYPTKGASRQVFGYDPVPISDFDDWWDSH